MVDLIPFHGTGVERFDHVRAFVLGEQRGTLVHQFVAASVPMGVVVELVFHDQRNAAIHHRKHVGEQRHMLVVAVRRGGRRGDQRRHLLGAGQWFGDGIAGPGRGEQRDARQFAVSEVFDAARIAGHAFQVGVVHNDHLAVKRQLQIEFYAIPGLAGGGEGGQRILGGDRAGLVGGTVAGFLGHAAGERHIVAGFGGVPMGQAGTGVVQTTVGVPRIGNRRHEVAALVVERARRKRPGRGARGNGAADDHISEQFR